MPGAIIKSSEKSHFVHLFHNAYTAWVVLLFGFIFTGAAWYISDQFVQTNAQQRFENRANEITSAIHSRMIGYEHVLWGGVGFFSASGNVDREKFHAYVTSLNIEKNWPGIQGIGYSIPVTPENKSTHTRNIRAEGFPEYTIKPPGDRNEYSAIVYLEPFDWRNKRAFGYDMWSNDMRRQAMTRARDTGEASTSGIITLVQETADDVQKGFLTYLPLYADGLPVDTVEQRRVAFLGWVYSPFRMGNLMEGILGSGESEIEYEIFDGEILNADTLLYDSNDTLHIDAHSSSDAGHMTSPLNIQGRSWTLNFTVGKSQLSMSESNQPTFVAIAGLTVDFLLFYIISSLALLQRRAEKLALDMTSEVREARDKLEVNVRQLSASNDELSKFAYVASHDLQEPLRMVASFCGLLKTEYAEKLDKTAIEYIDFAVDGATRMKSLVEGLLDYSRVGQDTPEFESVDCETVMAGTLSNLKMLIKESEADITFGSLPTVLGEASLIGQLFQNLILNGIKFRRDLAPRVHVSAVQNGGMWEFSFADNGIGIEAEYVDQIFVIFKRLHKRDEYAGNGMGLAICKKIVTRHLGRIWVEPNDPHGSRFNFSLPATQVKGHVS